MPRWKVRGVLYVLPGEGGSSGTRRTRALKKKKTLTQGNGRKAKTRYAWGGQKRGAISPQARGNFTLAKKGWLQRWAKQKSKVTGGGNAVVGKDSLDKTGGLRGCTLHAGNWGQNWSSGGEPKGTDFSKLRWERIKEPKMTNRGGRFLGWGDRV